ncbi:MAG: hypothetical protein ACR2MZ_13030 [Candidatus Dormibacter sp.]|uniref:hypothetical protein n=1 Tax=Candidatus Dormibacter sp. TaxID=2973982 RepID=UPI000DB1C25E|nr:MAG: hypothetical protein DLM66_14455 [Candidatus Dormibacteraeota bacterium]
MIASNQTIVYGNLPNRVRNRHGNKTRQPKVHYHFDRSAFPIRAIEKLQTGSKLLVFKSWRYHYRAAQQACSAIGKSPVIERIPAFYCLRFVSQLLRRQEAVRLVCNLYRRYGQIGGRTDGDLALG